jgi:hypothetical protein
MSSVEPQPLPEFHPAHWAALTTQRHRMMDVRSVLACARYVLLNEVRKMLRVPSTLRTTSSTTSSTSSIQSLFVHSSKEEWLVNRVKPSADD